MADWAGCRIRRTVLLAFFDSTPEQLGSSALSAFDLNVVNAGIGFDHGPHIFIQHCLDRSEVRHIRVRRLQRHMPELALDDRLWLF